MKIYKFIKTDHPIKSYKSMDDQTPKSIPEKLKNYNNEENKTEAHYKKLEYDYQSLIEIMAHMDNQTKTSAFTVAAFSKLSEDWSSTIHSFAKNVQNSGWVSDKAWNKEKIIDSICVHCRDMIQQYCGEKDNSKISVNVIDN